MTTGTFFTLAFIVAAWAVYALSGGSKLNKILERTVIFGLYLLPFIPFVVSSSLFFPFITGKNFLFRLIVEVMATAWVVLALRDPSYRPKNSPVFWGGVVLIVGLLFSTLFGADTFRSFWSNFERMEGYVTFLHLAVLFLVAASVLAREKIWNRILQINAFAGILVCVYCTLQLMGFLTINQGGVRVDGTFGNATYLAIYCVFSMFIAGLLAFRDRAQKLSIQVMWWTVGGSAFALLIFLLALTQPNVPNPVSAGLIGTMVVALGILSFWLSKKFSVAWMYAALALFEFVILYYTATRGAILGLLGSVVLMALIILIWKRDLKVWRNISIGVIAVVVIGVLGFVGVKNIPSIRDNPVLGRFASISLSDSETTARFYIWGMAWKGFVERPIFGWGPDNFNLVFNKFYAPQLYSQEQWFDRTHDVVLDWLISGGIVGLLAYLFIFGSTIYLLWKKTKFEFLEKTLITGLFVAYFVNNIFVFDNITSYILYLTFIAGIQAFGGKPFLSISKEESAVSQRTASHVVLPIAIAVGLFAMYLINYPGYTTNRNLLNALQAANSNDFSTAMTDFQNAVSTNALGREEVNEQIVTTVPTVLNSGIDLQTKQSFAAFAQSQIELQVSQTPDDAREQLFAGNFYTIVGEDSQAEAAYGKALALSPAKQTIMFSLGTLYINEKKFDQALSIFKQAYEEDTNDTTALEYYMAAAIYSGNTPLYNSLSASTTPDVYLSDNVATVYVNMSDWKDLINLFQKRIALLPENVQNRTSLVAALVKDGDNAQAISQIQTIEQMYPSYKTVGDQAIASIKAGKGLGQ